MADMRGWVFVVLALVTTAMITPHPATALGSKAYPPGQHAVLGGYEACQHQRVSLGGEERLELVMVGFVGTIDGTPVEHAVLHLTSFERITNPCNTATPEQGTVGLEFVGSGTGVSL